MKRLAAVLLLLGILAGCRAGPRTNAGYDPREGDILFQSFPHTELTDTIEGVTRSPRSHCGMLARRDGRWVVIEAIQPVCETPLAEWIARGRAQRFEVFRLKAPYRERIPAMIAAARTNLGRPYDLRYEWDDAKLYCSELVYKAFHSAGGGELGTLQALGDLNWRPHEAFIRRLEGGGLPLDRRMITPQAVAEAPQLEKIFAGQN